MNKGLFSIVSALLLPLLLSAQDTISIAFIGDVMQHSRQLQYAHKKGSDTLLSESYDYSSYFKYTEDILSDADFAVANMEFVCNLPPFTGYPSFSAPASLAQECKECGIDLFLCANNHIFDKGEAGFKSTVDSYQKLGVHYIGVYRNREERDSISPIIVDIKGIRTAFINFTYGTNAAALHAVTERMDSAYICKRIEKAKELGAEIIIALPHWGTEYSISPSKTQYKWRDLLYRNGVSAIVGSHPHVVQPIEEVRDRDGNLERITAYSLGNYISNMSAKNTQIGFLFILKMTKDEDGVRLVDGENIWLWCSRGGRFETNYTTFPVKDFIGSPEKFPIRYEYDKMKETYNELRDIIKYGE